MTCHDCLWNCELLHDTQSTFLDKITHIKVISSVFLIVFFPLRTESPLTESVFPGCVLACPLADVADVAELALDVVSGGRVAAVCLELTGGHLHSTKSCLFPSTVP